MRPSTSAVTLLAWAATAVLPTSAIQMSQQPTQQELLDAANQVKDNMMTFYNGNRPGGIPGYQLRPDVYYWWTVGGMLGQLIQHWHITGNDSLNSAVSDALLWQSQDNKWFAPKNQSNSEGNDDQAFWAFAALDAAETNFPAPPTSSNISWLGLAQGVFNNQIQRWDTTHCNGGMRWQMYIWNNGWDYKNIPANGGLFQIASRLYRYTGNQTYGDWAEKVWDWVQSEKLVAPANGTTTAFHVYDGFDDSKCSSSVTETQYSYNMGQMMVGAAYMYNATGNQTWLDRVNNLMEGVQYNQYLVQSQGNYAGTDHPQFGGNIFSETASELQTPQSTNNDQPTFKAYTMRWFTLTSQLVPSTRDAVSKILTASAVGAAGQCVGKSPGAQPNGSPPGLTLVAPGQGNNWCGRRWYQSTWDGFSGFGEQMSAMSVFQNAITLQKAEALPLTGNTGGTSVSDPGVGSGNANNNGISPGGWINMRPITGADKFGAAVLTILGVAIPVLGLWFMLFGQ